MPVRVSYSFWDIAPILPSLTDDILVVASFSSPMGEMTAAVPVPKASSSAPLSMASISSSTVQAAFADAHSPRTRAARCRTLRVMPGRMEPVQRGGDDLAVDLEEDVHGADFLDVLALHAVQPEHLGVALLLGRSPGRVMEAA